MVRAPTPIASHALVRCMESLADPTRLRLLRLLERHELGVLELCDIVQLPQSTVSRHLKVLVGQQWLSSRRQGTAHLYRMILDELAPAARRLWTAARESVEAWAAVQQDQLRLARLLRQRRRGAKAFFAGAAGQWDKLRGELYGEAFTHAALLALLPGEWTVADLGCGTGATAAQLAPHVKRVIGVDASDAMLKAARQRTEELGNVELRRGDLAAVPIDDASCDAALLLLVLTYVAEPVVALSEAARILRPGGTLVLVDLLRHDRDDFRRQMGQQSSGFEPAELERSLTLAGFAAAGCQALPPAAEAKGPALVLASGARGR